MDFVGFHKPMNNYSIEMLHTLPTPVLMDMLVEYTSRFTHLLAYKMYGEEFNKVKNVIKKLQMEISVRNSTTHAGVLTHEVNLS